MSAIENQRDRWSVGYQLTREVEVRQAAQQIIEALGKLRSPLDEDDAMKMVAVWRAKPNQAPASPAPSEETET